ncbi:alkylated DNA repair protein alkB homolog 8 isoform X2 [Zootermopsis nevadensis]|uniref:alkylated DNA repair protein alkB homolog 8 isoform X2 n=1 Tax=Zootermopsis nevadensis TaxID=136037 RepID=UPI000B8EB51E|nr:alkylated DNA repair protein alkB homolog 8 isoform X2 [Zootermopsis nevadensis]
MQVVYVMVANAGLVTGLQQEQLLELTLPYGGVDSIIMLPGKSYCFLIFKDVLHASRAYVSIHGKIKLTPNDSGPLYLAYAERVPEFSHSWNYYQKPPGLILLEEFVTEDEEESLLNCIDWKTTDSHLGQTLKHRRVKHYGYEFRYDINSVDKDCPLSEIIPSECNFLLDRLKENNANVLSSFPTQLTVNHYQPGQGIPPHVDTHSAFEDPILSLSLGSSIVMEFRHQIGQMIPVLLPRRSLLIMSEEARYAWSHGITPRKTDVIPTQSGDLTIQQRGERTSFTFRCIRKGECTCVYHDQCDSYKKKNSISKVHIIDDVLAAQLESLHVHEVYEEIANHFSHTRHKPWPNVVSFVQSLPFGSLLVDVGCGNGKYFGKKTGIFEIGCDHSVGLADVCRDRGFEVFNCNCLSLPLKSEIAEGCLSIAVLHHLATKERRLRAVEEMVRILLPGGKALIYVWAKEQERYKTQSSYLKQDRKNRKKVCDSELKHGQQHSDASKSKDTTSNKASSQFPSLPIHTNRTQFQHQDLLVPWKLKVAGKAELDKTTEASHLESSQEVPTFYRYYHVFQEGELECLCSSVKGAKPIQSYYDQGNWCIVLEKI